MNVSSGYMPFFIREGPEMIPSLLSALRQYEIPVAFGWPYTPYSKMAAILVFFCFQANWPLWPRSRLKILLNFTFESEVIMANLHGNKRILKWRPFWSKVYSGMGIQWPHSCMFYQMLLLTTSPKE